MRGSVGAFNLFAPDPARLRDASSQVTLGNGKASY